jgi:hypothetical protein
MIIMLTFMFSIMLIAHAHAEQSLQFYSPNGLVVITTTPCAKKMRWEAQEYIGTEVKKTCWHKQGDKVVFDSGLTLDVKDFELAVK